LKTEWVAEQATEQLAKFALCYDTALRGREKLSLLARFGSAVEVLKQDAATVQRLIGRRWNPTGWLPGDWKLAARRHVPWFEGLGVKAVFLGERDYPLQLSELYDPPFALFYRGMLSLPWERTIAIVGTRQADPEALERTEELAANCAAHGLTVISGLATGIDAAAHRGALSAGGATTAVLGTSPDRVYPRSNQSIADDLLEKGALISEYPPGLPGRKWFFPRRNRIIAGLCRGVVIGQAPRSSGSLITAELALRENRDLFVLSPAPLKKGCQEGTLNLFETGARDVSCARDILDDWNL
jgi:DNA processing protein